MRNPSRTFQQRRAPSLPAESPAAPPSSPWLPVVLLLAAILPYLNSLHGSFHYDDVWEITRNPHLNSFSALLAARPITRWFTFATLAINNLLHGRSWLPGWHIGNIALHAATAVSFYYFLCLWTQPLKANLRYFPFVAALLFAVHPLATEPVNYIRARAVILYALGTWWLLIALIQFHRAPTRAGKFAAILLGSGALVVAATSKEVGGPFALLYAAAFAAFFLWPSFNPRQRRSAILILLAVFFLLVGWLFLSGRLALLKERALTPLLGQNFLGEMLTFFQYLGLVFLPLPGRLSIDHHILYFPLRDYEILNADVLLAILALAALLAAIFYFRRRQPQPALLALWVLLGILPYWFILTADMLVEYKFYLSLAPACALIAWLLVRVLHSNFQWTLALCFLLAAPLAFWTYQRNIVWRSEISLWQDALDKAPRRARTRSVLAWAYLTDPVHPDPQRGLQLAQESFDLNVVDPWPDMDPYMIDTLAEAWFANGFVDQALRVEEAAAERAHATPEYFQEQLQRYRAARAGAPASR